MRGHLVCCPGALWGMLRPISVACFFCTPRWAQDGRWRVEENGFHVSYVHSSIRTDWWMSCVVSRIEKFDHTTILLECTFGGFLTVPVLARWAEPASRPPPSPPSFHPYGRSVFLLFLPSPYTLFSFWRAATQLHLISSRVTSSKLQTRPNSLGLCFLLKYLVIRRAANFHWFNYFSLFPMDCTGPEGRIHVCVCTNLINRYLLSSYYVESLGTQQWLQETLILHSRHLQFSG